MAMDTSQLAGSSAPALQPSPPAGQQPLPGTTPTPAVTPAGTFKPKADLDPNASFDWPETRPGGAACEPGTYTGTFHCDYGTDDAQGVHTTLVPVDGPLSFTLARSMDGEFLEIANGELNAVANGFFGFHAVIEGTLDCSTLQLDGMIVDGVWALGDPTMGGVPGGDFTSPLTGTLDEQTQVLAGDWNLTIAFGTCPGAWSVSFVP